MSMLLRPSSNLPVDTEYRFWLAVTGTSVTLDKSRKLPHLAGRLEAAFNACRDTWWLLGRQMYEAPGAYIAYAPTCGVFGSDFGLMLAWVYLCRELTEVDETTLVVCDDPWLYRQLADIPGVLAVPAPNLSAREIGARVRGLMSRLKVSLITAQASFRLQPLKKILSRGEPTILVYGHPQSNAEGRDAYFGDMMIWAPYVRRLLHTDCPMDRAKELAADGRTASLHAWGSPFYALTLFTKTWRPLPSHLTGPFGWLVRRAAALENSGGGLAMNRWQMHCQRRWMQTEKPACVIWPWENFNWERDLCRSATAMGIPTYGYQHTVIGPHQLNYSMATNTDGPASLPRRIIANGPAYQAELIERGIPEDRIDIGGAFRFQPLNGSLYDPGGPVFVPLSGNRAVARYQLQAATLIADSGRQVLVKDHPMYPVDFKETETLHRSYKTLMDQTGLSLVLYSTGTSGLEAVLAGIPALRLMLDDRLAIDVLPKNIQVAAITLEDLPAATDQAGQPCSFNWNSILAEVDRDFWTDLFERSDSRTFS